MKHNLFHFSSIFNIDWKKYHTLGFDIEKINDKKSFLLQIAQEFCTTQCACLIHLYSMNNKIQKADIQALKKRGIIFDSHMRTSVFDTDRETWIHAGIIFPLHKQTDFIILAILEKDFCIDPVVQFNAYFIDVATQSIFFPYDDRGFMFLSQNKKRHEELRKMMIKKPFLLYRDIIH